jgi:hypothetical protein
MRATRCPTSLNTPKAGFFQDIYTEGIFASNHRPATEPFPAYHKVELSVEQKIVEEQNAALGLKSIGVEQPLQGEAPRVVKNGQTEELWLHESDAQKHLVFAVEMAKNKWAAGGDESDHPEPNGDTPDGVHPAFVDSNGGPALLMREINKWLDETFANSEYRLFSPNVVFLELRTRLCIAFTEYMTSDQKLREICVKNKKLAKILGRRLENNLQHPRSEGCFAPTKIVKWFTDMNADEAELQDVNDLWEVWHAWAGVVTSAVKMF